MGKKRMVRWQRKPEMPGTTKHALQQLMLRMVVTILISLLMVLSALQMLRSVFPVLQFPVRGYGAVILIIVLISTVSGFAEQLHKKGSRQLAVGAVCVLAVAVLYRIYQNNRIDLEDGMLQILQEYMTRWNLYYKMDIYVQEGVEEMLSIGYAFTVICMVTGITLLSNLCNRVWVMGVLPGLVYAAELLVGLDPDWRSLALLFAGLLFCFSGVWKSRGSWSQTILLGATAAGILLLVGLVFQGMSGKIATQEKQILSFQKGIERAIRNIQWDQTPLNIITAQFQNGQVDNQSPEFSYREVIRLTAEKLPEENVYLRGYYADTYADHNWEQKTVALKAACGKHGLTTAKAADKLLEIQNLLQKQYFTGSKETNTYKIDYTGMNDSYAYLPYFSDYATVLGKTTLSGDYSIRRAWGQSSLSVTGSERTYLDANSLYNSSYFETDEVQLLRDAKNGDTLEDFAQWYDVYVQEQYLEVPSGQNTAQKYACALAESDFVMGLEAVRQGEGNDYENLYRLELAEYVSEFLDEICDYSQELDEIPGNTDPVDYFLSESFEGYCVHFASAGVFLLRGMGVPARYCTGYCTSPEEFDRNEDGSYTSSVQDSYAHAWAEIYLDHYGWVPIEMTAGYEHHTDAVFSAAELERILHGTDDGSGKDSADTAGTENESNVNGADSAGNDENDTAAVDSGDGTDEEAGADGAAGSETDAGADGAAGNGMGAQSQNIPGGNSGLEDLVDVENQNGGLENDGNGEGSTLDGSGWGFAGEGGWAVFGDHGKFQIKYVVIPVVGVIFIILLIIIIMNTIIKRHRNVRIRISEQLRRKQYQTAILYMNQRLYRRVRKELRLKSHKATDDAYRELLEKKYPEIKPEEWNRYMELVKKAAFSKEVFCREEAAFVYRIYRQK